MFQKIFSILSISINQNIPITDKISRYYHCSDLYMRYISTFFFVLGMKYIFTFICCTRIIIINQQIHQWLIPPVTTFLQTPNLPHPILSSIIPLKNPVIPCYCSTVHVAVPPWSIHTLELVPIYHQPRLWKSHTPEILYSQCRTAIWSRASVWRYEMIRPMRCSMCARLTASPLAMHHHTCAVWLGIQP